jgi:hypothetical protein
MIDSFSKVDAVSEYPNAFHLLLEPLQAEWRGLGVQQSRGWIHYAIHRPEPHILLYRRPKGYGQPGYVPQANVPQPPVQAQPMVQ